MEKYPKYLKKLKQSKKEEFKIIEEKEFLNILKLKNKKVKINLFSPCNNDNHATAYIGNANGIIKSIKINGGHVQLVLIEQNEIKITLRKNLYQIYKLNNK